MNLLAQIAPELLLVAVASALFLLGVSNKAAARRLAPMAALATLVAIFLWQALNIAGNAVGDGRPDDWYTVTIGGFAVYVRAIAAGLGAILVLMAWPTNADATGSESMNFGHEAGEFFALMLLSISGVSLVAGANDLILLFLGIELVSIPTYIMVSISRPLPAAQEAGVKYFFLGAMAAAVMLFGFSYIYGTTGLTRLDQLSDFFNKARGGEWTATPLTAWQLLGVIILLVGFGFKIAAVPLHAYIGDVYQGAATPVTAFLAFIPKASGFVAIIKVLAAVGGAHWSMPPMVVSFISVIAVFTMSVGNVLGLLQYNVKRVLAYSSIAHSGYMLVGVAALVHASSLIGQDKGNGALIGPLDVAAIQKGALAGVLFYLTAYGLMNAGAFGVLMLLPSRASEWGAGSRGRGPTPPVATSAETFDDLAGQGKRHPLLGLAMAICCFSLIGIPMTVGFLGKLYLIQPAFASHLYWLVIATMINAAVSAAYYLRIVATMYLRPAPESEVETADLTAASSNWLSPIGLAVTLSVAATLLLGTVLPIANRVSSGAEQATQLSVPPITTTAAR